MNARYVIIPVTLLFILGLALFFLHSHFFKKIDSKPNTQKPREINVDGKVKVKYPEDFTIVLVGDSMTEYLGNSDELRKFLGEHYPGKTFEVLNYGFGSTNILSLQERLEKKTFHGREFRPITEIDFDLILLESFGHNPLSEYPLKEGLKAQSEALERAVETIKKENPRAKIVFVATIGPNKKVYGYRNVDLSPEKRELWANERIAYMKNHIEFAHSHQIPVVNIYEKSLDQKGDTNRDYISDTDYIHPSPTGVVFISREIARFLFAESILQTDD